MTVLIGTMIDNATNRASGLSAAASGTLGAAVSRLTGPYGVPSPNSVEIQDIAAELNLGDPPEASPLDLTMPTVPGSFPGVIPVPGREYGSAPSFTAVKPAYTTPTVPAELPHLAVLPPTLGDVTIPPSPEALNSIDVTPPALLEIVVPLAPEVSLPEFTAAVPEVGIAPPGDLPADYEANYAGAAAAMRSSIAASADAYLLTINPEFKNQMAKLESRLSDYLDGGTALPVAVEQAIYNRARDKTNGEYLKTRDQIMKEGAQRGFTIPGGAQYSALAQARQAASDNNARAAMDIAIKQAEMEQANIQFAITQSSNLRGVVLNATAAYLTSMVQLNGQALEYAKELLQAQISLYDIYVKIVSAKVEVFKATAQVYEIRLKAALAVYEVYKAHIEGLKAQSEINRAQVDAFTARMNAYGALANTYKALIDGSLAKAQIEKIKADIYGTQVQAYSATVSAKQAEWQGYAAQIQGNTAKAQAYSAEVQAYSQQVAAFAETVRAFTAEIQGVSAANESTSRVYGASVQAYSAIVGAKTGIAQANTANLQARVQAFVAAAGAAEATAKARIAAKEATMRSSVALYEATGNIAVATAGAYNSYSTQSANAMVAAGNVYAGMASSALAGINVLAAATTDQGVVG